MDIFSNIGAPVLIISHPRSGTHLTIDLIRKNFKSFYSWKFPGESLHSLYLSIEGFLADGNDKLNRKRAIYIISKPTRPLIKMHTYSYSTIKENYSDWIEWIEKKGRIIYVTRDPRSMILSYYEYAQNFEARARVNFSEFIKQPFCGYSNRFLYWANINRIWTQKEDVLTIKFEEIIKNPHYIISRIGEFIGEECLFKTDPLPKKINNIWQFRLMRIQISPENTSILGTKKMKKQHDWRKEINEPDLEFIRKNAGAEMNRIGYMI